MSNADFLGRAIEQVKKAVEKDNAGDYQAAYTQYYQARELAQILSRWRKTDFVFHSGAVHAGIKMYVVLNQLTTDPALTSSQGRRTRKRRRR